MSLLISTPMAIPHGLTLSKLLSNRAATGKTPQKGRSNRGHFLLRPVPHEPSVDTDTRGSSIVLRDRRARLPLSVRWNDRLNDRSRETTILSVRMNSVESFVRNRVLVSAFQVENEIFPEQSRSCFPGVRTNHLACYLCPPITVRITASLPSCFSSIRLEGTGLSRGIVNPRLLEECVRQTFKTQVFNGYDSASIVGCRGN